MHSATNFPHLLLLIVVVSLSFPSAVGKAKSHKGPVAKTKTQIKLVKETPIFDTSGLPERPYFQLGIKHTQILFPEDPEIMLHGSSQMVNLRAEKNKVLLRGQATHVERESTIDTREYGIKSHFRVDLRKMSAKFAPDIARLMEAQIAEGRRKIAREVEREEPLMNRELQSPRPKPKLPVVPGHVAAAPDAAKALDSALEQSKQREQQGALSALLQYKNALSKSQGHAEKMPAVPNTQVMLPPVNPLNLLNQKIPSASKTDTSIAERQMTETLAKANLKVPSPSDLDAEMIRAKKMAFVAVTQSQPAINTILTNLRTAPNVRMPEPAKAEANVQVETESTIQWDAWHAKFAQLARNPILRAVSKAGNPSGANTVEVTVLPNHHIAVRLTQSGNAAFDQAILQAYQSLDGNPALEYPIGSRRTTITFLIDNKHAGGVPSSVKSQTSVGDKEVLRHP